MSWSKDVLLDVRASDLPIYVVIWCIVWLVTVLFVLPRSSVPGHYDHIILLNALHGLICTLISTATLFFNWDTTNVTALSVAFFLVDFGCMLYVDGGIKHMRTNGLRFARKLDYVHHVLGAFWGILLHYTERNVCQSGTVVGNPYVWIQTNEISTPFYNLFRLKKKTWMGVCFASTFFASRIVFNTIIIIPMVIQNCNPYATLGCSPYFLLQYIWFYLIIQKIFRTFGSKKQKLKT